ncbi:alpha/beta fold hydrolase [[Mycobacterium] crassicus]|uniref:Alpha/beta hydrolase n=1 Tax=[Mycobacterium] crassicus TaxID=2872309 RepID=A0ABU5XIN1_9MYCO|nr:alpha/beta hydrolase [Mycolicibacter sp. MYC098]MEB3022146.1 alpha/beta hydrolase [Mycolicibacter sp. MYC098]
MELPVSESPMCDGVRYETFDVPVVGGNLRVGSWGDGGPVILAAHGITGNHLHFGELAKQLQPNFTVVAPDLRGRGRSSDIAGPFSMADHADDLVAVLDFFGVEQATVIGHSMGAFAAVVCAERHPGRVQSLVLIDGGIPLDLGAIAGLPTEQLLANLIGPAIDRLHRTFESLAAYLDYWRQHPAFTDTWDTRIEEILAYDLGGRPPTLRSTVRAEAVIADAESELDSEAFDRALAQLAVPAILFRAERGILNQAPPLYSDSAVAAWAEAVPKLRSVTISATNHYTILLTERGAKAVSDGLQQFLR